MYDTLLRLQGENNPDRIRGTVLALDKDRLAELMLYDIYDEDTILLLTQLEEKLGGLADVIVKKDLNVFGGYKPVVIGAALNTPADPNKNISVIFARSEKTYDAPAELDPEKTVVMNVSLGKPEAAANPMCR